ncbi:MAG: two-component sensor histidine kinase [Deltaproteobacteria bacterium]|nr:MAG: two-component sensor histidine kinase [Deltaproteobacteria bacterium]
MKRFGIHIRLLLAAVLLIGATAATLGYVGGSFIHEFVRSRFDERMTFITRYLALNAELGILINATGELTKLAENLMSQQDVVRVTIYDRDGQVLADEARKSDGSLAVVEASVLMRELMDETSAFRLGNHEPGSQIIGRVRVAYSLTGINQLVDSLKKRFAWLSAGMAGIACVCFYFISRSMVAPVTHLARVAREVSYGDWEHRAPVGRLPETRELALAFNGMLDSLAASQNALREAHLMMGRHRSLAELGKFSMMIAHEVKNPLGIIKSSFDLLRKELEISPDHVLVGYVEDELIRLNRLIEDFLLFSRPAKPRFRPTDLNGLMAEIAERYTLQNEWGEAVLMARVMQKPFMAQADGDLLNRAIVNILKNAFEVSAAGDPIEISTTVSGNWWYADIRDRGPGITKGNERKLFEPFFTTRAKGTGLGLAFTYQVITAHGGSVSAENHAEQGAVFRIAIPGTSPGRGDDKTERSRMDRPAV